MATPHLPHAHAHAKASAAAQLTDAEILAQIPAARAAAKAGLRARSARYSVAHKTLFVTLTNGTVIGIPTAHLPALRRASPRQRSAVTVLPAGIALHWASLDVDLSVPALIREALGADALRSLAAAEGGKATSERKAAAARENGAKGGRPRKAE